MRSAGDVEALADFRIYISRRVKYAKTSPRNLPEPGFFSSWARTLGLAPFSDRRSWTVATIKLINPFCSEIQRNDTSFVAFGSGDYKGRCCEREDGPKKRKESKNKNKRGIQMVPRRTSKQSTLTLTSPLLAL